MARTPLKIVLQFLEDWNAGPQKLEESLQIVLPMLRGEQVNFAGQEFRVNAGPLPVPDGLEVPVLSGVQHAAVVMNGEIPAVMINGRGKANPTADEVATEFRHD